MFTNGTLRNWNNPNVPNEYVVTHSQTAIARYRAFLERGGGTETLYIAISAYEHAAYLKGRHRVTVRALRGL